MTNPPYRCAALLIAAVMLAAPSVVAADAVREVATPRHLEPVFAHLLSVADSSRHSAFDPDRIDPLLAFVMSDKEDGVRYHSGRMNGATSAYHEFAVKRSLADLLRLAYHPLLPSHLTVPSTVRLSYWSSIEGENRPLPRLWTQLAETEAPVRVDGIETVVNTPDLNSGAYYEYDLDRTLILFSWRGKKVLLSLSRQRGRSEVGKKGAVLGSDDQWNYLYTGQQGISRAGLGWVDSYMYGSFSVTAYVEEEAHASGLRCGIFHWIDAGWAGINVVRTRHIHRGLVRFSKAYKTVLEAPQMGDVDRLVRTIQQVENLSDEALREKAAGYYRHLHQRYGGENRLLREWYGDAHGNGGHLARMNRREMEAMVCIEVLKAMLGKDSHLEVAKWTAGIE